MGLSELVAKFKRILANPYRVLIVPANWGFFNKFDDAKYLSLMYRATMNCKLDLKKPKTFNEKLQWLKINNRKDAYTTMVDKYAVKDYVAGIIGEEYIIPTLGVWENVDEIDFEKLPNQFVLKCNHNSGLGMYICRDKKMMNISAVKADLKKGLKENYYLKNREWPYKNVHKRIIAEKYMVDENSIDGDIPDYKIHCFNGIPQFILVCKNRFSEEGMTEDFFSTDWEHLDFKRPGHLFSNTPIEKPVCLEKMLYLAKILSSDIPFSRIDFYVINKQIFFGEVTFFPNSGFKGFEPQEWDEKIGQWITII